MMDEQTLRSTLSSLAREAGAPPPFAPHARRAAAMQRLAWATTALLVTASLLMAGVAGARALLTDPAELETAGNGTPAGMRGSLVAKGREGEGRWFLTTFSAVDGALLCMDYRLEGLDEIGGGAGCWEVAQDKIGLSFGGPPQEAEHQAAYGWVPRRTGSVRVTGRDGTVVRAGLHRPPDNSGLPVRFFSLVYSPPDIALVEALTTDGALIAKRKVARVDQLQPVGRRVVVGRGKVRGEPWVLVAQASNLGPCEHFSLGRRERLGGGRGCHIGVPVKYQIGFSQHSFDRPRNVVAVYGAVVEDAVSVEISYGNDKRTYAHMVEAPPHYPLPLRFFYLVTKLTPEELHGGVITTRDAQGGILERVDMCSRETAAQASVCSS